MSGSDETKVGMDPRIPLFGGAHAPELPAEPRTNPQRPKKKRFEDQSVTYKQVVYAIPFLVGIVASAAGFFGSFVLGRAAEKGEATREIADQALKSVRDLRAEVRVIDAGTKQEIRELRADMNSRSNNIESKVNEINTVQIQILREVKAVRQNQ